MRTHLDRPHLSITSCRPDHELARLHAVVEHKVLVSDRCDLEEVLGTLLAVAPPITPPFPKTLDLIGHATPEAALLDLGGWVIDRRNPAVTAFFRELADHEVLPRLGVTAVRLLGCGTATTQRARDTIVALSEIVELEVLGTTGIVHAGHFNRDGFDPAWEFLLVGAGDLGSPAPPPAPIAARTLDLDSLPAIPLIVHDTSWPRLVASVEEARKLLALIRRSDGAPMPGLLATPMCELALPAARAGLHHVVQLLLEGQFVRVYPDHGDAGLLFPVKDPSALLDLVATLPVY